MSVPTTETPPGSPHVLFSLLLPSSTLSFPWVPIPIPYVPSRTFVVRRGDTDPPIQHTHTQYEVDFSPFLPKYQELYESSYYTSENYPFFAARTGLTGNGKQGRRC